MFTEGGQDKKRERERVSLAILWTVKWACISSRCRDNVREKRKMDKSQANLSPHKDDRWKLF